MGPKAVTLESLPYVESALFVSNSCIVDRHFNIRVKMLRPGQSALLQSSLT